MDRTAFMGGAILPPVQSAPPSSSSHPTENSSAATGSPGSNPQSPSVERKSSHTAPHGLNARSCVTCRRRKVKCDKKVPCSNCTKAQTQCVFPAPGRAPRRPRQGGKVVSEREAELLKRLRRLEGVVEELSGQVELDGIRHSPGSENSSQPRDGDSTGESIHKPTTVRVVGMDEASNSKKAWLTRGFNLGEGPPKADFVLQEKGAAGRLVLEEGKSQYLSNPYWATLAEACTFFEI
jgi:hypothetical protein